MNLLIIEFLITSTAAISVYLNNICHCEDLYVKEDCINHGCRWDPDSLLCFDLPCNLLTSWTSCDSRTECAWDEMSKKCSDFSQCIAYKVLAEKDCYYKGNSIVGCVPTGKKSGNFSTCTEYLTPNFKPVDCQNMTSQQTCSGKHSRGDECKWSIKDNLCKPFKISKCEEATEFGEVMCDSVACIWLQRQCQQRKCKHQTTQDSCQDIPNLDKQGYQLCSWDSGKCEDFSAIEKLTAANCMSRTKGTHFWKESKIFKGCQECPKQTYTLRTFLLLMIILSFTL